MSCSKSTESPSGNSVEQKDVKIYPHSSEFKSSHLHGLSYYENAKSCVTCHSMASSDNPPAPIPAVNGATSCVTCHQVFPHSENFKKSNHGTRFLENRALCTQCHGKQLEGSKLAPTCLSCHSYPHTPAWALPARHGQQYVEQTAAEDKSKVTCLNCHGETSHLAQSKSPEFISCSSCHTKIPHTDDVFVWGGHGLQANKGKADCLSCHTDFKRLMKVPFLQEKGCVYCHKGMSSSGATPRTMWLNDKEVEKIKKERKPDGASINKTNRQRKTASEVK